MLVLLAVVFFTLLTVGCVAQPQTSSDPSEKGIQSLSLRVANVTQIDHPMNKAVEFFIEKIKTSSKGRIKISNFPARQLGDDRELFEQVQQGSLDMALVSAAPIGSTSELAAALQLPFMFTNWDQWLEAMSSDVTVDLLKEFEKFNVKALAIYDSGFRHLVSVKKKITSVDDLAGMQIRVAEAPLHISIFKALGASPTPIPYGEIYTCLQNGIIDGLEMDLPAVIMEKHYEVAKNITLSKHFTWPAIFMMNLDKWNKLSEKNQQLFMEKAREVLKENVEYIRKQETMAMQKLEANNISVTTLSDTQRQAFVDATRGVVEEYKAKNPKIAIFADFVKNLK